MKLPTIALVFLAISLLSACSDDVKVSDITIVKAYFVACDSVLSMGYCYGPSHRTNPEEFTVTISKNEVARNHLIFTFHDCKVFGPRRWDCLDTKNNLVSMTGTEMKWDELTEAHQASADKVTYCFADERKGKKSSFSNRLLCLL